MPSDRRRRSVNDLRVLVPASFNIGCAVLALGLWLSHSWPHHLAVPLIVLAAISAGWNFGTAFHSRHMIIDAGRWRAEYRRHGAGCEEWSLETGIEAEGAPHHGPRDGTPGGRHW
jgi:hypothetical protein